MKINLLLWVLISLSFFTIQAQTTFYPLHPSVGDTIDLHEKLDYALFPKIKHQNLEFIIIQFKQNGFLAKAYYSLNDSISTYPLEQAEIIEAQKNIEKINAYFRMKQLSDSIYAGQEKSTLKKPEISPLINSESMHEKALKEARMKMRLEADRIRMEENRRGISPRTIQFEVR